MMGKVRCIAASDAKAPEAVSNVTTKLLDIKIFGAAPPGTVEGR